MNIDQQLNAKQSRRMAAQDRYLSRLEKREEAAGRMIGELASGKCYIWPVDGKYREGSWADLVDFLVRNKYV